MPLIHGFSKKSVSKNIKTEEEHGKPHEQAIAIALSEAKEAKKQHHFKGGVIDPMSIVKAMKAKRYAHGGMVESENEEFLSADMETPEKEAHEMEESEEMKKKRILANSLKR